MRRIHVKAGDRYGRLTVVREVDKRGQHRMFECKCDCGNVKTFIFNNLRKNHSTTCGCSWDGNPTHGMSHTIEYDSWCNMRRRCTEVKNHKYSRYGGRGITVCDRWKNSFENFYEDMGASPGPEYSLGRIDNDGDYCPVNCRWETAMQQVRNRSNTRMVTIDGVTRPLAEWAEISGLPYGTLQYRLDMRWSPKDAISFRSGEVRSHRKMVTS